MTNEQFDQLVNRIQTRYAAHPLALRLRIALWVGLGYAGFLAILLLVAILAAVLVVAAIVADKEPSVFLMAIVAVLVAFGLCQAMVFLWVPMKSDSAREATAAETPQLFRLIDRLQRDLRSKPFQRVQITSDLNACVQMIPRLGVFGFQRNDLYLGLPLMRVLTVEQLAAVLAHEMAHCSSRHDRFGTWIYRLRRTWARVFAELQNTPSAGTLRRLRQVIIGFIDWYWPRFNAYAFVLSRADEYEADRIAVDWAGVEPMADALFRIDTMGNRLNDKFWTEMTQLAKTENAVPDDICSRIEAFLDHQPDASDGTRWIEKSIKTLTGTVDTHPSLSDRLAAVGANIDEYAHASFPLLPANSAAQALLGQEFFAISQDVNQQWQTENRLRWQNVYQQARRAEKQLASVQSANRQPPEPNRRDTSENVEIDADTLWRQAAVVLDLHGSTVAETALRDLLGRWPSHSQANLTLGRILLDQGNSEGEQFLSRILEEGDNEWIPVACHGLISYFQQLGQADRVRETKSILSRFEVAKIAADKERSTVTAKDRFVSHGLDDRERGLVLVRLEQESDLATAWLVRKDLQHFPRQRLFILVVQSSPKGFFGTAEPDRDRKIVTRLITDLKLPGRVLIVAKHGSFSKLARKVVACPDSQIYQKSGTV